jgi:hypothetical protein
MRLRELGDGLEPSVVGRRERKTISWDNSRVIGHRQIGEVSYLMIMISYNYFL